MWPSAGQWNAIGFIASLFLVVILVYSLSSKTVLQLFIVLGQGHFFLAYLYQWRAGKMTPLYAALYLASFAVLWSMILTIPHPEIWGMAAAGSIFSIHFFVDEFFIHKKELDRENKLLGAAFVFLYTALLVGYAFQITAPYFVATVAIALCIPLIAARFREKTIHAAEMFFLVSCAVLIVMIVVPITIRLITALSFIILFHYLRWYFYFLFRFMSDEGMPRLFGYLRDVFAVNAIIIALFVIYATVPSFAILGYLFDSAYFFGWTILHVLFSIRIPSKFKIWLRLSA